MYKILFVFFCLVLSLFDRKIRAFPETLSIVLFIVTSPFYLYYSFEIEKFQTLAGTLGASILFGVVFILLLAFLLFNDRRKKFIENSQKNLWLFCILLILILSIINPFNVAKSSSFSWFFYMSYHVIFYDMIVRKIAKENVLHATFMGLFYLSIVQVILSIFYPLLGFKSVTGLFHQEAINWSTRNGTRAGAVGTFVHPGLLALFSLISCSFFWSSYLNNYRRKLSLIVVFFNLVTIVLTYSRASYISVIIILFIEFVVFKNQGKRIFTISNIIKYIIPLTILLFWVVYYSPLSDTFLKSNLDDMYAARLIHWLMGIKVIETSPLIGVGVNTHLEYLFKNEALFSDGSINEFFFKNPIHNVHLIILVELGLLGFAIWLLFFYDSFKRNLLSIYNSKNLIISISQIGILLSVISNGFSDWAPLSTSILPLILFFTFIARTYSN